MNPQLIQLLIAETPNIVEGIKALFKKKNPDAPQPTSADIIAAFEQAYADSNAKDEMLKAALQAEIDAQKSGG